MSLDQPKEPIQEEVKELLLIHDDVYDEKSLFNFFRNEATFGEQEGILKDFGNQIKDAWGEETLKILKEEHQSNADMNKESRGFISIGNFKYDQNKLKRFLTGRTWEEASNIIEENKEKIEGVWGKQEVQDLIEGVEDARLEKEMDAIRKIKNITRGKEDIKNLTLYEINMASERNVAGMLPEDKWGIIEELKGALEVALAEIKEKIKNGDPDQVTLDEIKDIIKRFKPSLSVEELGVLKEWATEKADERNEEVKKRRAMITALTTSGEEEDAQAA